MSYLLFANADRQREADEKLDSKILKKIKAKNKAAELSKDIGKLFINDEIIPIKKIKYEKKYKELEKGDYIYYKKDGYNAIIYVFFSKYSMEDYLIIHLKNDDDLESFESKIKNNEIIYFNDYDAVYY